MVQLIVILMISFGFVQGADNDAQVKSGKRKRAPAVSEFDGKERRCKQSRRDRSVLTGKTHETNLFGWQDNPQRGFMPRGIMPSGKSFQEVPMWGVPDALSMQEGSTALSESEQGSKKRASEKESPVQQVKKLLIGFDFFNDVSDPFVPIERKSDSEKSEESSGSDIFYPLEESEEWSNESCCYGLEEQMGALSLKKETPCKQ